MDKTSLQLLLDDLKDYKVLSQAEERTLLKKAICEKDKESRDIIINSNIKLIFPIAKRYYGSGLELEDLVSYGIIGLIEAIDNFDLSKNYRFNTYATWKILQKISRAVANHGRSIRIPVYMVENINKLRKIERELTVELGREPTEEELAAKAEMTIDDLKKYKEHFSDVESLETPLDSDGDGTLGSLIEDSYFINPEESYIQNTETENILSILSTLTEREAEILKQHYGIGSGYMKSFEEISQEIGITKERVRQIENKALRKLRSPERAKFLKDIVFN